MGVKKSNFPGDTVVTSGASFDYFDSGVNKKISFTDLVGQLGVTGTIVQDGAVTGTPILDTQGSVNNIRNLEPGAGIVTTVSAENGVTIKSGLLQDGSGVSLTDDLSIETPTIASLIAGTGVSITKTSNTITIEAGDLGGNRVPVTQASDFPAAVGGVRTLADFTIYDISGMIDIGSDRFVSGDNSFLIGKGATVDGVVSSTSSPLITVTNKTIAVDTLTLNNPNGDIFAFSGNVASSVFFAQNVIYAACKSIGNISGFFFCIIAQTSVFSATDSGYIFGGTNNGQLQINETSFGNFVGTAIDLLTNSPTFNRVFIGPLVSMAVPSGATGISILPNSGNLQPLAGRGIIEGSIVDGPGTETTGFDVADIFWFKRDNFGIDSSQIRAQGSIINNATATVIGALSTPVLVDFNGGFTTDTDMTSQFIISSDGRFTYTGLDKVSVYFNSNLFAEIGGGGSRQYTYFVYKTGVQISSSASRSQYDGSNPDSSSVSSIVELETNDYLEIFVQQEAGSFQNITVNTTSANVIGV